MTAILSGYGCVLLAFLLSVMLWLGGWPDSDTRLLSLAAALLLVVATAVAQITLYRSSRPLVRARAKDLTGVLVRLGVVGILAAFEIALIGRPSAGSWIGLIRLYTWTIGLGALFLSVLGFWELATDREGDAAVPVVRRDGSGRAG